MLDVTKDFVESFGKLSKEEQEKSIATMPMYMVDVLIANGYEIHISNGKPVVEREGKEQ